MFLRRPSRVQLPVELLSHILDFVAQDDDTSFSMLRQCSLVSRLFCSLSQPLLFQSIVLDPDWSEEDLEFDDVELDVQVFYRLVLQSPHIAGYVRELSYSFCSMDTAELSLLLPMLPNLRSLSLDGYDEGCKVRQFRGPNFQNSINASRPILPRLTRFKLAFFRDVAISSLHLMQNLRWLEVTEADIITADSPKYAASLPPLKSGPPEEPHPLRTLVFGLPTISYPGYESPLVDWIWQVDCRLSSLSVSSPNRYHKDYEVISACNLINACQSSLRHLEISNLAFRRGGTDIRPWNDHFHLAELSTLETLELHLEYAPREKSSLDTIMRWIADVIGLADEGGSGTEWTVLPLKRLSIHLDVQLESSTRAGSSSSKLSFCPSKPDSQWPELDRALGDKERFPNLANVAFVVRRQRDMKAHDIVVDGCVDCISSAFPKTRDCGRLNVERRVVG